MEKWRGESTRPSRRLFWRVTFRFGRRINSHINVATTAEGVGFAGQPFCIQRDGMLMAGIQFTAGEHEFQLFHQQRKGLVQVVRIRVAEPPSDTGAVGKVMQPVAFLYQTGTKTGRHGAGQSPPGAVVIVVGKRCPGVCLTR